MALLRDRQLVFPPDDAVEVDASSYHERAVRMLSDPGRTSVFTTAIQRPLPA